MAAETRPPNHGLVRYSKAQHGSTSKQSANEGNRRVGRPSNLSVAIEISIRLLHADGRGMGKRKISKTLRIGVAKVYEALKSAPTDEM
jgi:hypothetical protein